ncbi:MAG: hypothetical protein KFF68_02380 [Desulfosarcina sp.]|nr:hypothetical protein [Desulfosarcina sp.]
MEQLTTQLLAYARGGNYEGREIALSDFVCNTLPLLKNTLDPSIVLETSLPDVTLTIEDSGRGMDEATKKRVFEPFFTTKGVGRGLGLAAVDGIVKNYGGWISVESQIDRGTCVCIYLPAAPLARLRKSGRND